MSNPHAALRKELKHDIAAYMGDNVVSDKLIDSVSRWPVATEEFVVYRGQPKENTELPTRDHFFSATWGVDVAKRFAQEYTTKGNVLAITVKPGVRYLELSYHGEREVLLEGGGLATYGAKKVRVKDDVTWTMAIPVTYAPKPPPKPDPEDDPEGKEALAAMRTGGGRRKTRRTSLRLRG
jgi:hypothetical protein